MFNQIHCFCILLRSAYVNPGAVEGIADDLLALGDEFLNQVGGMEEGVFRDLCQSTLLDKVDTGIGIVVILWLLNQAFDVTTIKIKDAKLYADIIWDGSNRHFCIMELEVEEKILIVDIGEEI